MCTENEEINLGLEIGGEISRFSSEKWQQAFDPVVKRGFLKKKALGLIIQNPTSGFGVEKDFRRGGRFINLATEYFWREPRMK